MAAKHSAHAALVETLRKEPLSDNLAAFRESRELTTHVSDAITEGLSEPWSCAEYAKAASGFVGALAAALGDAPLKHAWLVAMSSAAGRRLFF